MSTITFSGLIRFQATAIRNLTNNIYLVEPYPTYPCVALHPLFA